MLSKHAWTIPLKIKNGNEMATVIAKIIRDDGRCPKNLQTDMGKEFYNANVQKLLKKHNINYYSTYSIVKVSVVEWFNMLKNDMWKQFTYNGLTCYCVSCLSTTHESIELSICGPSMTPTIADKLLNMVYSNVKTHFRRTPAIQNE